MLTASTWLRSAADGVPGKAKIAVVPLADRSRLPRRIDRRRLRQRRAAHHQRCEQERSLRIIAADSSASAETPAGSG